MKCRIQTTLVADQDIRDIIAFIFLDRPESAQAFAQELWAALDRLSMFPESGAVIRAIGENVRYTRVSSRFRRYLIVYRYAGTGIVEIVRVAHGARDIPALLSEKMG